MVEIQPGYLLLGCVVIIIIHQVYNSNPTYAFMIVLFISTFVAYFYMNKNNQQNIDNLQHEQSAVFTQAQNLELPSDMYKVYKHPQTLKYSKRIVDYNDLIKSLDFVDKYDKQKLNQIKTYGEHFFKTHFNIMIGKYDPSLYISNLYDAKKNALKVMHELVYVVPKISRLVDIPNIDKVLYNQTLKLNAIMSKYIKIVHHAFSKETIRLSYKPPYNS